MCVDAMCRVVCSDGSKQEGDTHISPILKASILPQSRLLPVGGGQPRLEPEEDEARQAQQLQGCLMKAWMRMKVMKKVAVWGAEEPRVLTTPPGLSRNSVIWFKKEPTSREPRKVVMTCSNSATGLSLCSKSSGQGC